MELSHCTYYLPTKREVTLSTGVVAAVSALSLTIATIQTVAPAALIILSVALVAKINYNKFSMLPLKTVSLKELKKRCKQGEINLENHRLTLFPERMDVLPFRQLNLNSNHLTVIPSSIGNLTNLKQLYIDHNPIIELPDAIGSLSNLRHLSLDDTYLTTLPESIGNLSNLRGLCLSNTHLTTLPDSFGNLINLTDLRIDKARLVSLPDTFGHLLKLEILHLSFNQFVVFPRPIVNLTGLLQLDLECNKIESLPDSISNMTNLRNLFLEGNKLTSLPHGIGSLTQLMTLIVNKNNLTSLCESIGNLAHLTILRIQDNPDLKELPLSLGECEGITHLFIKGTGLCSNSVRRILAMAKERRNRGALHSLPRRLELWKGYAKDKSDRDYDLAFVHQFDENKKYSINEWLLRLSRAKDFKLNQSGLADTACSILQDLERDEHWAEIFFNQVEVNNTACEDRAAQAFNELYVAWRLHKLDNTVATGERLAIIASAAKTFALRNALANILAGRDETESVEIYLYYESTLQEELGLLTAIQNMRYSTIGKRDWIDVKMLKAKVQEDYLTVMASMDVTKTIAKQDAAFLKDYKSMLNAVQKRLRRVKGTDSKIQAKSMQILKRKERKERKLLMNWLPATLKRPSRGVLAEQA